MATKLDLEQRYHAKAKRLHEIYQKAADEDRGLTAEERSEFDQGKQECFDLKERIGQAEELEQQFQVRSGLDEYREQGLRELKDESRKSFDGPDPSQPLTSSQRSRGLAAWMRGGRRCAEVEIQYAQRMGLSLNELECTMRINRGCSPSGEEFGCPRTIEEVLYQARCRRELRATNVVGTANLGGDTVPDEMMLPLERALLAFGGMRQVSTIISTRTGANLPMPSSNDTTIKGEIILEDAAANEQAIAFGQITLGAFKYSSKMILVSLELMQDSATNMAALVGDAAGERIGRIHNDHFTTGTGTTQPRGITLDSFASGVTTSAATAVAYADLVNLKHSVDPAYRIGAQWMMSDAIVSILAKLVDGDLRPLWLPSMVAGNPDMILGHPVVINQSMPTGAGAKAIVFGQLSKYYIREVLEFTLVRLDERYAERAVIAFLAWTRNDGRLRDAGTHPVKHLLLGA